MNSSSGSSTTTIDKLPDWIEDEYAAPYLNWALNLYNDKDKFDAYEGQTYADQNDNELDGIANLATRGRDGDVLITKGETYIKDVLDGDYLDGTTADFDTTLDKIINKPKRTLRTDIMSRLGGTLFYTGDNSGINLSKNLVSDSKYYTRTSRILYAQNYKDESTRQEQTLNYGIEYGKQDVVDAEILRTAGLYQREYNQGALEDAYKVYYEEQTAWIRKLDVLGNAIRTIMGTQTAIDKPYYRPSPVMGVMGGAMAGAAVGAMFAAPTGGMSVLAGALIGAAGGGLLGALSTM
jgi:hypothetical protein